MNDDFDLEITSEIIRDACDLGIEPRIFKSAAALGITPKMIRAAAEEICESGITDGRVSDHPSRYLLVTHRLRRPAMDETGAELIVSGTAPSAQRSGFAWCEKPVC
jgi:hypothetical protein